MENDQIILNEVLVKELKRSLPKLGETIGNGKAENIEVNLKIFQVIFLLWVVENSLLPIQLSNATG